MYTEINSAITSYTSVYTVLSKIIELKSKTFCFFLYYLLIKGIKKYTYKLKVRVNKRKAMCFDDWDIFVIPFLKCIRSILISITCCYFYRASTLQITHKENLFIYTC